MIENVANGITNKQKGNTKMRNTNTKNTIAQNTIGNSFAKKYWMLVFLAMPMLAFAADTGFKTGLQQILGIGMMVGFATCVFFILEGVYQYRQGGNWGKDLVGLAYAAGATVLVSALYAAFGMSGASLTPSF